MPESGVISWLSVIPKVLLAGAITLMDELYYKLAVWLNDKGLSHVKNLTQLLINNSIQKTIVSRRNMTTI